LHVSGGTAAHVVADSALVADTIATRLCLNPDDSVKHNNEYLLWLEGKVYCSTQFKEYVLQ
jgi:hypothetical protein